MLPSPGLPAFDYVAPESPQEVTRLLLRRKEKARLFMGGTDLLVRMRDGFICPELLIDVKHVTGITRIHFNRRQGLRVGAAVDMNSLARYPAVREYYPVLLEALNSVASYQLRTRATLGGNLCNASPAADTAPAALVLDATLVLHGRRGEREVPVDRFFAGPGKTVLQPGEFLSRIEIPPPPKGAAGRYLKLGRNAAGDLALVGVAVLGYPDRKSASGHRFRIALASVAPTPLRVPAAEALLCSAPLTPELLESAATAAMKTARPIDDVRSSGAYRRAMVKTLTRRAVEAVLEAMRGE